jgi:hypothetical protein
MWGWRNLDGEEFDFVLLTKYYSGVQVKKGDM